jgi:hypothetical protein
MLVMTLWMAREKRKGPNGSPYCGPDTESSTSESPVSRLKNNDGVST